MIRINLDMDMPLGCANCILYDEEFFYCHGHENYEAWEVFNLVYKEIDNRPNWCPLIEVKDET